MTDRILSPTEIVTSHSWDKALLTTYVLSLSFYETQLHKFGLFQNNCRDIRIACDADGYQMCLGERQAKGIGNEYRVTPALLPKGIFHPKLTWLCSDDLDVVMIGSGNLTFGGYGKNLECIDLIRSDEDPNAFRYIADIFEAWYLRDDLEFPTKEWIQEWVSRGSDIANKAGDSTSIAIPVSSTVEPVGEQLEKIVQSNGGARTIRVLSPYYDSDAWGIMRFAKNLGARELVVGLLPGQEELSTFPFGQVDSTDMRISAAQVNAPQDLRGLHAKVFEVDLADGRTLLMSGSVNATSKSLLTTNNIEVASVRFLERNSGKPFSWKVHQTPVDFVRTRIERSSSKLRAIVSASIQQDNTLTGVIKYCGNITREWDANLQRGDGTTETFTLVTNELGEFKQKLRCPELFVFSYGIQLKVENAEGYSGEGWVDVEMQLLASRRNFLSPAIIEKLLRPDADEDDEIALVRYLSMQAQQHLAAFAKRTVRRDSFSKGHQAEHARTSEEFLPMEALETISANENEVGSHQQNQAVRYLDSILIRIRHAMFERQSSESKTATRSANTEIENEEDNEDQAQVQKDRDAALLAFNSKLQELVRNMRPGLDRSSALCMWIEISQQIEFKKLDKSNRIKRTREWLNQASKGHSQNNSTEAFEHNYISAVLTLSKILGEIPVSVDEQIRGRMYYHELLEAFCDKRSIEETCETLDLFNGDYAGFPSALLEDSSNDALKRELEALLEVPTIRQQIERITKSEGNLSSDLPLLKTDAGKQIALSSKLRKPILIKPLNDGSNYCPHCHIKLPVDTIKRIEHDRIGKCIHPLCQRIITAVP